MMNGNKRIDFDTPNQPFTMRHQHYMLDNIKSLLFGGFLSDEHCHLLSGIVVDIRNTSDHRVKQLRDFSMISRMTELGVMTKEQLSTVVEQNRHAWEHNVRADFWAGLSVYCTLDTTPC